MCFRHLEVEWGHSSSATTTAEQIQIMARNNQFSKEKRQSPSDLQVQSPKPSNTVMKLALMRAVPAQEDQELPLLQGIGLL